MKKRYWAIVILLILALIFAGKFFNISNKQSEVETKYVDLKDFQALTKDDTYVRPDYLRDYDLIVMYFWSPGSELSRSELGNFAKLSDKLPENIGKIDVALDVSGGNYSFYLTKAKINDENVLTILSGDKHFKMLCDQVVELPTTLFLDSQGNIMDHSIIGIQLNYKEFEKNYLDAINKNLKKLKKGKIKNLDENEKKSHEN